MSGINGMREISVGHLVRALLIVMGPDGSWPRPIDDKSPDPIFSQFNQVYTLTTYSSPINSQTFRAVSYLENLQTKRNAYFSSPPQKLHKIKSTVFLYSAYDVENFSFVSLNFGTL